MNAATLAAHMAILAIGIPEVPLFPDNYPARQLPTALFGAPIGGEAPDFRAPLPGSPISESMSSWKGLICSA
jgi:hypothetical protein